MEWRHPDGGSNMDEKSKKMWKFYPGAAVSFAVLMVILLQFYLFYYIFSQGGSNVAVIIIIILLDVILGTYLCIYLWLLGKNRRRKQE